MSTPDTSERSEPLPATDRPARQSDRPERQPDRAARQPEQQGDRTRSCPECDGRLAADQRRGETACAECGLVVSDHEIDTGPEWRAYDAGDRKRRSRVGPPTTMTRHDDGLTTTIDWRDRDAKGTTLSPSQRERMRRLRTWDERFRTRNARERGLEHALGEIDRMGSALGLPEHVRETASVIHRRAIEADLLPGRSIEGVSAACVYAAGRRSSLPRSLDEVATVSRVDRKEVARSYRHVARELGLGVEPADPADYLGRFASRLDLGTGVEKRARELLAAGREDGVTTGRSPVSMAAAALYAAALLVDDASVTQEAVGEAAGVSAVTIRNRYRELLAAAPTPSL